MYWWEKKFQTALVPRSSCGCRWKRILERQERLELILVGGNNNSGNLNLRNNNSGNRNSGNFNFENNDSGYKNFGNNHSGNF